MNQLAAVKFVKKKNYIHFVKNCFVWIPPLIFQFVTYF